jgi:hypothetical protein
MRRIAGTCSDGRTCPTVYETERGTFVFQGNLLDSHDLVPIRLADGETAVEVPAALVEELVRAHRG